MNKEYMDIVTNTFLYLYKYTHSIGILFYLNRLKIGRYLAFYKRLEKLFG